MIVFSDLDGTLLDFNSYDHTAAIPALNLLRAKSIPLILCTSKTRAEVEPIRETLGHREGFIVENGGAVYLPADSGLPIPGGAQEIENYFKIPLGVSYSFLRSVIVQMQTEGFRIRGFGDLSEEEVASRTGLNAEQARRARIREFDEPFIFEGSKKDDSRLKTRFVEQGLDWIQGGRFSHLVGGCDKGRAVRRTLALYHTRFPDMESIAIGDGPNDLPMLQAVDRAIVVQRPDGRYDALLAAARPVQAPGVGPVGFRNALIELLTGA